MRTTIARDIADIASCYNQSGRSTQTIRIYASESTLQKAVRHATPGFFKVTNSGGGGYRFFTTFTPLSC